MVAELLCGHTRHWMYSHMSDMVVVLCGHTAMWVSGHEWHGGCVIVECSGSNNRGGPSFQSPWYTTVVPITGEALHFRQWYTPVVLITGEALHFTENGTPLWFQ